ncbi:MAG TPA: hypothetical protein VFP19_01125 [Candidatus Limnocylindrales bacterium]|nr:hypothetical protein [Candidatus Limnocylindrales bacterium]
MARAKQTNRAEARRRYRQSVTESNPDAEAPDDAEPVDAPARGQRASAGAGAARPSIGSAFREAYHPAHLREDLRALPGLLTHAQPARIPLTRTVIGVPWFLVSAFLVIAGFAALAVDPQQGALLFQLLSLPPGGPTLPVLLVGFTASRASYLQGLLIGILDLVLVGVYVALVPNATATTTTTTTAATGVTDILVSAAITGLPTSLLFAGAAAWYRRFLQLSSPRRVQPAKGASRSQRSGSRAGNRR